MDFYSLPRRQLQTLCKQYKIPANTTNVAMATALDNLLNKGNGLDGDVSGLSVLDLLTPCKSTAESTSLDKTGFSGRLTRSQRKKQIEDMRKFEIMEPAEEMIDPPVGLPDNRKPPMSAARRSMVAVSADHVVAEGAVPTESNNQKPPISTGKRIRRKVIIDNSDGEESAISQQESCGSKVAQRARSVGRGQCKGLTKEAKTLREEVFGNVSEQSSEVARKERAQDAVDVSSLELVGKIDAEDERLHVQMSSLSLESSAVENGLVLNFEPVLPKSDEDYSTVQEFNGQTIVGEFDGVESYFSKAAREDTFKDEIGNREAPGLIGMENISNSGTVIDPTKGAVEAGRPIVNETKGVESPDGSLKSVDIKEPEGAGQGDITMVLNITSHSQINQEVRDDVPVEESDGNSSDTETENGSLDIDETEDGAESDLGCEDAFKDIVNETKAVSSDVESELKEPEAVDSIEARCSPPTVVQSNQEVGDNVPVQEFNGSDPETGNGSSGCLEVTEETVKFQDGAESDPSMAACEDDILKGADSDFGSVPEGVDSIGLDEIICFPPTVVRDVSSHRQEDCGVVPVEGSDGCSSDTTSVESAGESSLLELDDKAEKHKETVVNDHAAVDVEQLSSALAEVKLNEYGQMQEEGDEDACGKDSSLGKNKIQKKPKKVGHGKENPLFGLSLRKLAKLHKELHEKKKKKSAPRNDAVTPLSPNTRKNNCAH